MPCHFCTAGHLPADGGRLPPRSAFSPGSSPSSSGGAPRTDSGLYAAPRFSDRHHCGLFLGDLLMLPYGLNRSWVGFSLRRFSVGQRPFLMGIQLVGISWPSSPWGDLGLFLLAIICLMNSRWAILSAFISSCTAFSISDICRDVTTQRNILISSSECSAKP
jgi:hypothetical protein